MAWYRKTTPSSYPATAASNFTDSSKNWRQYKNMYRRTSDLETASLTAVPGRYTDSTRTWRRIKAIYRYTSYGTWQKVFGKFAGQPYPTTAALIKYDSYTGTDVGQFAEMGPGSTSIAQGATGITYLWGRDAQDWQNIENLSVRTRTFVYGPTPIPENAALVTNDEGNFDGDKLRNTEAVISQYDKQYLWYRDRITLTNNSTGTSYSQTVRVIKQQPAINSLGFKTNNTVSAGSVKYVSASIANQWYRSVDKNISLFKWYILDSQFETPTEAKLYGSTGFNSVILTETTTVLSLEDFFTIPTTFGGVSTTGKWLHVKIICKNSSSDTDASYTVAPYNDVTGYIVAQIGASSATAPTSVSATSTQTYFDVVWSGQTNATIYRVYWSTSSSTSVDPVTNYDFETTTASWRWGTSNADRNGTVPTSGAFYYFYVSASSGNGIWTPYVRSTTNYSLAVANATAPTSVTTSANSNTITINWSGSTNAVKYRIYWTPSSNTTADPAVSFDEEKGNVSTWIWNSSDPDKNGGVPGAGNSYYFYVSASNTNNVWSAWTRSASAISLVLPPVNQTAPVISGGTRSFTLTSNGSWNPDDADGIYAYQWKYNDQSTLYLDISGATSSTLNLTTSAYDGLGIRCYVTATNAGGSATANSNTILASAPISKLSTPTNVVATDTRTDGVNITWTAVSGAAYYGIWWGGAPSYDSSPDFGGPSNPTLITGTSYLDTAITAGTSRTYYVQAYRTSNPTNTKSDWSAGDSGTRIAAPVKLSTPTGVNATDTRTDGVNITWNAVSGASYYGVWWGGAPSYDSSPDFPNISGTSYLDTAISAGSSRDYYVQAFAAGNPTGTKSDWGGPNNGTRISAPATPVPVLSSITGNNALALGGTFSWSFTNSPTGYSILCTGPTGTVYTTSNAFTYGTTSFRPGYDGTGWQGAGNYTMYVTAQNAGGNSTTSSVTTYMN